MPQGNLTILNLPITRPGQETSERVSGKQNWEKQKTKQKTLQDNHWGVGLKNITDTVFKRQRVRERERQRDRGRLRVDSTQQTRCGFVVCMTLRLTTECEANVIILFIYLFYFLKKKRGQENDQFVQEIQQRERETRIQHENRSYIPQMSRNWGQLPKG